MSIPPTDADGLAKFLAGDVDTFFGDPGGLRISAAPAKNDAGISTSPPPNSNDNPPPHQHPACVRIAELRLSLEAPAPGDQIRPPSGKSRVLLAGSALLLAAVIALGLAGAAVVKIVRVENRPVARAAVQSLAVAAQSPLNAGTADQASGTETTDKAPAAPSPLTALPVDESGGRAAMHRWYAERQSAINRAPSLRPAALHSPLPRPAAHSPWRPRRRPVTAAEFSDLLRTLAPPSQAQPLALARQGENAAARRGRAARGEMEAVAHWVMAPSCGAVVSARPPTRLREGLQSRDGGRSASGAHRPGGRRRHRPSTA